MFFLLNWVFALVKRRNAPIIVLLSVDCVFSFSASGVAFFGKSLVSRASCYSHSPPGGERDRPLSEIVKLPHHFILAPTPEDCIPLGEGQRLVCVGDVHGDFQAMVDFLTIAGVLEFEESSSSHNKTRTLSMPYSALPVSDTPIWTGNNTILVQCGDILDRGSQELACYQLLAQLSHQAKVQGGRVICLYGNHEALNAMGLFQYTTTDSEYEKLVGKFLDERLVDYYLDLQEVGDLKKDDDINNLSEEGLSAIGAASENDSDFATDTEKEPSKTRSTGWRKQYVGNQPARWATYEPNGLLSRSLLSNLKVAVQVGRTICVHGGLTKSHLQDYGGIGGLNEKAKEYILGGDFKDSIVYNNRGDYVGLHQPWIEAEQRQTTYINSMPKFLAGGIGAPTPLWMRDYSSPANSPPKNPEAMDMLDRALQELDCDRMVMGHTVQAEINAALDGKAWRIDVGASRGVRGGNPEVLEVVKVNGTEIVNVLTRYTKVPGENRHVWAMTEFL
jgi:Calcineurin-like phosphoesterase